jgi:hypothetical protein
VVLHLGQHHEVAAVNVLASPGVGDEVDRGRRVGREDRLLSRRAEPVGDSIASALIQVGRLDRERVIASITGCGVCEVAAESR